MYDSNRLKQVLDEVSRDVQKMEGWLKSQEPSPGVSYEDWIRTAAQKSEAQEKRTE